MPAPHHPADFPLLIKSLLPTPRQIAPDTEIVSDGLMRYRYRDMETRLQRLGAGLAGQGFGELAQLEVADARAFAPRPGWNGTVVSNLPYGERVGDQVEDLHGEFGARLRTLDGYRAALLTGSSRLAGLLRLSRSERHRILNGGIECQLVTADL